MLVLEMVNVKKTLVLESLNEATRPQARPWGHLGEEGLALRVLQPWWENGQLSRSCVAQCARGHCRVDSDICLGCRAPIRYLVLDGGGRHRSP